jgi:predicted metal-dependent peptidase
LDSNIKPKSAEEIFHILKQDQKYRTLSQQDHWSSARAISEEEQQKETSNLTNQAMANALRKALKREELKPTQENKKIYTDLLDEEFEKKCLPIDKVKAIQQSMRIEQLKQEIKKTLSKEVIEEKNTEYLLKHAKGSSPGGSSMDVSMIQALYAPPWEMAVQQWMEANTRTNRSYSKVSRRGQYSDFILPGYNREGKTIHILLDTSGSMSDEIAKVLGLISSFCEAMQISEVHIVQCDTEVTKDDYISPEELRLYSIEGYGGSDMSPGMNYLAEDEQVESLIVITDGYIDYPEEEMPYNILWVLTEYYSSFEPEYGKVIVMD